MMQSEYDIMDFKPKEISVDSSDTTQLHVTLQNVTNVFLKYPEGP